MKRPGGPAEGHDPHHHTEQADLDDPRDALELGAQENADLCAGCIKCCTYIAVEVDAPRAAWEYDQWIWALHHHGIELYVERPERWYLHVEARCRQLNDQGRCGIYGRHPVLCREYDPRSCERRLPLADIRAWFKSAAELEDWIRRERYRKPQRGVAPPPAAPASPAFVALTSLIAGTPAPERTAPQRSAGPGPRRRAFQSDRRRRASSGVS